LRLAPPSSVHVMSARTLMIHGSNFDSSRIIEQQCSWFVWMSLQ
jgi:hypothetical protein